MQLSATGEFETVEHRILRRIAILGIGFGIIGLLQLAWTLWRSPLGSFFVAAQPSRFRILSLSQLVISSSPVLLIIGAIALFRWKGWGRIVLMTWAMGYGIAIIVNRAAMVVHFRGTSEAGLFGIASEIIPGLMIGAFPMCVFLLLWRREFRDVFSATAGRGFEVLQGDSAPMVWTRPAVRVEAIESGGVAGPVARVVAVVGLMLAIAQVILQVWASCRSGFPATLALQHWLGVPGAVVDALLRLAAPLLLIGSIGLLRNREWGRRFMLAWGACHLTAAVIYWGFNVAQFRARSGVEPTLISFALDVAFSFTTFHAFGLVVLVILWGLTLSRTIRAPARPVVETN